MTEPKLIFYNGLKLHEAMHWDEVNDLLYFVAIRYDLIYSLDPATGEIKTYKTDGPVGGAVTDANGNIIEAEKSGIYRIDVKTGAKTFLAHILPQATMRYNHLLLDSRGRILVDVMGDELRHAGVGGLYSIDGENVRCLISGTTVANGIALNKDETKLYFADTPARKVYQYDYDIDTGTVSNEKTILDFAQEKGMPDGVMLDKDENYLWIAEWAGAQLSKWNIATGEKADSIAFPSAHVTSSVFGGKDGHTLYAATAKQDANDLAPSGGIFAKEIE